jgi:hypothetical protein
VRRITKSTHWCTQIIDGKYAKTQLTSMILLLIRAHVLLSLLNMPWDGAEISVHLVSTCRECDRMKSPYLLFDPLRPHEASWVHGTRSRAMYRFVEESETRQKTSFLIAKQEQTLREVTLCVVSAMHPPRCQGGFKKDALKLTSDRISFQSLLIHSNVRDDISYSRMSKLCLCQRDTPKI